MRLYRIPTITPEQIWEDDKKVFDSNKIIINKISLK